jgi:hypothetical protein
MACGLVFRVMTDDPAGCQAGPAGAEGHGAAASRCAALPWRLRPRMLSSRGESVEEHPWARQDPGTPLRTGWGRLFLILAGVLAVAVVVEQAADQCPPVVIFDLG